MFVRQAGSDTFQDRHLKLTQIPKSYLTWFLIPLLTSGRKINLLPQSTQSDYAQESLGKSCTLTTTKK